MTRLYIQDATAFYLEAEGLTLQVLARLIRDFSTSVLPPDKKSDRLTANRLRDIISYVEEHYQELSRSRMPPIWQALERSLLPFFQKEYRHVLPPVSE